MEMADLFKEMPKLLGNLEDAKSREAASASDHQPAPEGTWRLVGLSTLDAENLENNFSWVEKRRNTQPQLQQRRIRKDKWK